MVIARCSEQGEQVQAQEKEIKKEQAQATARVVEPYPRVRRYALPTKRPYAVRHLALGEPRAE